MPCCLRLLAIRVAPSTSLMFPPLRFILSLSGRLCTDGRGAEVPYVQPSHAFGRHWPGAASRFPAAPRPALQKEPEKDRLTPQLFLATTAWRFRGNHAQTPPATLSVSSAASTAE